MADEQNIRPEELFRRYEGLLAKEEEFFLDPQSGAIRADFGAPVNRCLACGGDLDAPVSQGYAVCGRCGTFNSAPRLAPEHLPLMWKEDGPANFFHKHVYTASEERRRAIMRDRLAQLQGYLQGGRVLEVGCSIGLFLDALREGGFQAEGVEVTPFGVERCREKGHIIHDRPIEEVDLQPGSLDAVVAWEVIAHLADPRRFLQAATRALKPGGFLFLTTPNANSLEYDTIWNGGGRHHSNLKPHVFLQIFSNQGLQRSVEDLDYVVKDLTTPGTMDLVNLRRTAIEENRTFNCGFFNNLLLTEGPEHDDIRARFQAVLSSAGFSGHAFLAATKRG